MDVSTHSTYRSQNHRRKHLSYNNLVITRQAFLYLFVSFIYLYIIIFSPLPYQWCVHQVPRGGKDCESGFARACFSMRTRSQSVGSLRIWTHCNYNSVTKTVYQKGRWPSHWSRRCLPSLHLSERYCMQFQPSPQWRKRKFLQMTPIMFA